MAESHVWCSCVCVAALFAAMTARPARGQQPIERAKACSPVVSDAAPTPLPRATLQTWADDSWLRFTNRDGNASGRVGRDGILGRFQRRMDAQYEVSLLTTRYAVDEDAEWHARATGVRFYAGSFDRAQMAIAGEAKATAALSRHWCVGLTVEEERDLVNRHEVVRTGIGRDFAHGFRVYARSSLQSIKSDMDGTAGVQWRHGAAGISADVTVLDYANNYINHDVEHLRALLYDSAYRYARQPVALRAVARLPLGRAWLELSAADVGPGRVRVDPLTGPDAAVAQGERGGYDGALVGYPLGTMGQVAAFATRVRARTERAPLAADGDVLDDFVLVEATRETGVLAIARPASRLRGSLRLAESWRTETRDYRRPGADDVDFADRALSARLVAQYGPLVQGPQLVIDTGLDDRRTLRGVGEVPGREPVSTYDVLRTALMFGWRAPRGTEFMLGARLEYGFDVAADESRHTVRQTGFQGRAMVFW